MTFRVFVTETAAADLHRYFLRAAEAAPQTAVDWLDRFEQALASLADNPQRCPFAPESDVVDAEIRQLIVGRRSGTFRVLFTIQADEVRILHIRRGVMAPASPDEFHE